MLKSILHLQPLIQLLARPDLTEILLLTVYLASAIFTLDEWQLKRVRTKPVSANPVVDEKLDVLDGLLGLRVESDPVKGFCRVLGLGDRPGAGRRRDTDRDRRNYVFL